MATHTRGDNVPKSVSLEPELLEKAIERQKALKLPSFSAYVQYLMREDLRARKDVVFREESDGGPESSNNKRRK